MDNRLLLSLRWQWITELSFEPMRRKKKKPKRDNPKMNNRRIKTSFQKNQIIYSYIKPVPGCQ